MFYSVIAGESDHASKTLKSATSSSSSDSGSSSGDESEPLYHLRERRQTLFSYRFNEFDDLINSAIQVKSNSFRFLVPRHSVTREWW
jgi:remodeling and spacing factor 1